MAKRTKWHLAVGVIGGLVFVYPCLFGVSHNENQIWYWLCRAFLFLFVFPVVIYCVWQLKHQDDAITYESGKLNFATMMPWGRSSILLCDIKDCVYESIPEVRDHLILIVTEECYQKQFRSRAWAECSAGQLRFDMMYTTPSMQVVANRIKGQLSHNP